MKLAALFATIALAQEDNEGRAMSLQKKIDNAGKKCSVYMEKAMVCEPPSSKIGKYNFRLEKVSDNFHFECLSNLSPRSSRMPSTISRLASATRRDTADMTDTVDDDPMKSLRSSRMSSTPSCKRSPTLASLVRFERSETTY